ncbi:MAG: orotidine-5'-phosphate decarboxylase [Ignavibacteriae bacterium]|nr:orotidine-5'-phosphate decarboxylase [Ignavibacteriota bacterium]
MNYSEKIKQAIKKSRSNLIIGLDPDLKKIPEIFLKKKNPVLEFNKSVINATKDFSAGYKLNLAFYEALGKGFHESLRGTVEHIPGSRLKICDGKRGDIGNTDEYYAKSYFDEYGFDSMTVNPYMGRDSVEPFLSRRDKGIYVLALTSNPGSEDFQQIRTGKKFFYERVIEKCIEWDRYGQTGFVIGANHTSLIKKITTKYKNISILIPGIGAQGNDIDALMKNIKNNIFLVNSSRGIIFDSSKFTSIADYEEKTGSKAEALNDIINSKKRNR